MRRWMTIGLLTAAVLLPAGMAQAQDSNDRHDRDRDDEEGRQSDRDRFALAVGAGLVEPLNKTETYYMASLRIRTSGRGSDDREGNRRGDEGITGYLEPEVGYWSSTDKDRPKGSDLLLGVNADETYSTVTLPVSPGSVLVLATDGLLDDDGADPGCNVRALLGVLGDGRADEPERLADRLLASPQRPTRHGDDIALMVARIDEAARPRLSAVS